MGLFFSGIGIKIFVHTISAGEKGKFEFVAGSFLILKLESRLFLIKVMFMISCSGVSLIVKSTLNFLCINGSIFSLSVEGKSIE